MNKRYNKPLKQRLNAYQFSLKRQNKKYIIIGSFLMCIGYLLMIGGSSPNPDVFDAHKMYSFTRITLCPFLILFGVITISIGILKKFPDKEEK